jgi:hypothetical protein
VLPTQMRRSPSTDAPVAEDPAGSSGAAEEPGESQEPGGRGGGGRGSGCRGGGGGGEGGGGGCRAAAADGAAGCCSWSACAGEDSAARTVHTHPVAGRRCDNGREVALAVLYWTDESSRFKLHTQMHRAVLHPHAHSHRLTPSRHLALLRPKPVSSSGLACMGVYATGGLVRRRLGKPWQVQLLLGALGRLLDRRRRHRVRFLSLLSR